MLVGKPLSDMRRYVGYQNFEIGEQKPKKNHKGDDITMADWSLESNSRWRVEGPNGFVLSWEHFDPERRDEHAAPFYARLEDDPLIVQTVELHIDGVLRLSLSEGFTLTFEPWPFEDEDVIDWGFMPPDDDTRGDLRLTAEGLGWHPIPPR